MVVTIESKASEGSDIESNTGNGMYKSKASEGSDNREHG